jgi:hypothetical protein
MVVTLFFHGRLCSMHKYAKQVIIGRNLLPLAEKKQQ